MHLATFMCLMNAFFREYLDNFILVFLDDIFARIRNNMRYILEGHSKVKGSQIVWEKE